MTDVAWFQSGCCHFLVISSAMHSIAEEMGAALEALELQPDHPRHGRLLVCAVHTRR